VKPGDTVVIHGLRAAALPLVQAISITDEATGRMVVDNGRPGPERGPAAVTPLSGLTEVRGRVRMSLHGAQGEVNGALLDDGTVLRLPPPEAYRFSTLLQPGHVLVADGVGFATAIGKVFEVQEMGESREQMSVVDVPPGPGRGRRPPSSVPGFGPPGPPRP
jgi:hypothetical protein